MQGVIKNMLMHAWQKWKCEETETYYYFVCIVKFFHDLVWAMFVTILYSDIFSFVVDLYFMTCQELVYEGLNHRGMHLCRNMWAFKRWCMYHNATYISSSVSFLIFLISCHNMFCICILREFSNIWDMPCFRMFPYIMDTYIVLLEIIHLK